MLPIFSAQELHLASDYTIGRHKNISISVFWTALLQNVVLNVRQELKIDFYLPKVLKLVKNHKYMIA